jgi:hypothetical protein
VLDGSLQQIETVLVKNLPVVHMNINNISVCGIHRRLDGPKQRRDRGRFHM